MTALLVMLLAAASPAHLHAQQMTTTPPAVGTPVQGAQFDGAPDSVELRFERPGLQVPRYHLDITDAGMGSYAGEELPVSVSHLDTPPSSQPFAVKSFHVSVANAAKVFALARSLNYFKIACASAAKNVADTGKKTLTYTGMNGVIGSCTYNYTENKDVQTLTDIFQGIAETLDEGRKLDYLHRYDRLGLDAEMESFTREVSDGHAIELQTIASTLSSLAGDPDVMQRVRTRASALLTLVPASVRQSVPQ
jgi:hypothetical protein